VTEQEKLKRQIYLLAQTIETNAQTLASKTMSLDDKEALKRQMRIRVEHQKLLQQRLDRLSPHRDGRSPPTLRWYQLPGPVVF
jgi:hypothetical protein